MEIKFIPEKKTERIWNGSNWKLYGIECGHTRNVKPFVLCVAFSQYHTNAVVLRVECRAQHNVVMPGIRGRR